MKTMLLTIMCLFWNQNFVLAQQAKATVSALDEDVVYINFRATGKNPNRPKNWDEYLVEINFELFPVKLSKFSAKDREELMRYARKEGYFTDNLEISESVTAAFEKHLSFEEIHAGLIYGRRAHGALCEVNNKSCFNMALLVQQNSNDDVRINNQKKTVTKVITYTVTWQPPAELTGFKPTHPAPTVRKGDFISLLETIVDSKPAAAKPANPSPSKPTPSAGITIEKKDTSFQEAEAKRILQEKKAAAGRRVQSAAQSAPQFSPTQRKMIKLTGSSRQ